MEAPKPTQSIFEDSLDLIINEDQENTPNDFPLVGHLLKIKRANKNPLMLFSIVRGI